jgi:hypothetical protein
MRHHRQPSRDGKILVTFVLVLPVLLGIVGLVIDAGRLMAAHRHAQNAADSAALAAAQSLLRGTGDHLAAAQSHVQGNGLPAEGPLVVNNPPASGLYATGAKKNQYVEVIVTYPVQTLFIQVLGVNKDRSVSARAVAGYEEHPAKVGLILLQKDAHPGLAVSGGASLTVNNGGIMVYSQQAGKTGIPGVEVKSEGYTQPYAATTVDKGSIKAQFVEVSGGVDVPENFLDRLTAGTGKPPVDPLENLATPTTANGVLDIYWDFVKVGKTKQFVPASSPRNVSISSSDLASMPNQTLKVPPGIYGSISVSGGGGGTVTFAWDPANPNNPAGVKAPTENIYASQVNVQGTNVMFYNTGSDYNAKTGAPDSSDGVSPPASTSAKFGGMNFNAGKLDLSPVASGPFQDMLFYQRRWNTEPITVQSNGSNKLTGRIYSKWGDYRLAGGGTYNTQVVAGQMHVAGSVSLSVPDRYADVPVQQLFLVE